MTDRAFHLFVLFVLAAALTVTASGCDAFGGGDEEDGDDNEPDEPTVAQRWEGTYQGMGRELDYQDGFQNRPNRIRPTLRIAFVENTTTLDSVALSWENGASFIITPGPIETVTNDELITQVDTAQIFDSVETRFQFRLQRVENDTMDVDSITGRMRQVYGDNFSLDSTVVEIEEVIRE
jgi:hypothetical protein